MKLQNYFTKAPILFKGKLYPLKKSLKTLSSKGLIFSVSFDTISGGDGGSRTYSSISYYY